MTRPRNALAEAHHPVAKDDRSYPYTTQALLNNEQWTDVTVLGPPRTIAIQARVKGFTGMRLVTVQVEGEKVRRRIAVERLREHYQ